MSTAILSIPEVTVSFEVTNNSDWIDCIEFLVDNGSADPTTFPQLDLRGIYFQMEIRHTNATDDVEVVMHGSTADGRILIGDYPNYGWLCVYMKVDEVMGQQRPGVYVGDIVAMDGTFTRTPIKLNLTITEGITR